MILRKPYAFLIKHFKFIHIIITIFMAISLYKLFSVISFFGDYVVNEASIVGQSYKDIVYPTIVFVSPIIIIVFSLILLAVMAVKKKPYKLYIVNIVVYIAYLVIIFIGNSNVVTLEKMLVDIRVIKMVRDLTTMMLIAQIYPLSKNLVRAIGFDIKEFDFKKDLAELEINEEDNEEVEVTFSLDFNKIKRYINNGIRKFKYFYAEHKLLVNIGGTILTVVIVGSISFSIYSTNKTLEYNQSLYVNGFNVKVLNTYVTRLNYSGDIIENLNDNNSLIVIPVEIKNNSSVAKEFITTNIELKIGNNKYRHVSIYRDQIFDLGKTYQNDEIAGKTTERLNLVYTIPTKYIENNSKMMLKVITSIEENKKNLIPTYYNLVIKYSNLDTEIYQQNIASNEETILNNEILGNTKLSINTVDISDRFKINYKLCITKSNCIDSYEYITPPLNSNTDKALMKISGNFEYDEKYKISNLTYIYDLIADFGKITYKIGDKNITIKTLNKVNPTATKSNNSIYISVPKEILDSDNVELMLKIRNKEYKYVIK